MLCGPAILLSRLGQRAPLARAALPLLAAYAPEALRLCGSGGCARGLRVFARRPTADHAEVQVNDGATVAAMKKAIIAELQLDAPPDCVRLLREVEGGGAPVPLDSRRALAEQGVLEGSCVVVELLPSPAPLPPALPLLTLDADPAATPHLEYRGLLRSTELTLFCHAVRSAHVGAPCAASGTRMWRLTKPAAPSEALVWPLLNMSVLLERDFYARFLSESQWLGDFAGSQRKIAVLGQPGIGKSSFGLWLLAQLLRSNRTVVYSRNSSMSRSLPVVAHYVFHAGVAFETSSADLGAVSALLAQPSIVHISDSLQPRLPDLCHKVLIASPDPSVWRWFVEKEYANTAYFPLFDYAELEALREAEFGEALPRETLRLRVKAWGLTTRAAFSPHQREVGKATVKAMHGKSLEDLQRYMGEVRAPSGAAASDTPHSLFALQADRETLTEGDVTFRSDAVALRVVRQVALMSRDTLLPALQRLLASSTTRSVAGTVFEQMAIGVLGRGGRSDYLVRPLTDGRPAGFQALPASTSILRHFDSLPGLARDCEAGKLDLRKQYFAPLSPNIAAVDFIGPGLQLFQVTGNRDTHDLKVTSGRSDKEGLLALYSTLLPLLPERWGALEPHLDVYFVVPEGQSKGWKAQRLVVHEPSGKGLKGSKRAPAKRAVSIVQCRGGGSGFSVDGRVVEVRQHVMEVPRVALDEWLALPDLQRDAIDEAAES